MTITQVRKIQSCDDFELNIKRETLLDYQVTYPSDQSIKAVLFIIPGFGDDSNGEYLNNLRNYVAETFSIAVISVDYHCMHTRFHNGAAFGFDDIDIAVLEEISRTYGIDFSQLDEVNLDTIIEHLNASVQLQKEQGNIPQEKQIMLPLTLIPPNNEYQNFGVMQAIDHIYVYHDLIQTLPNLSPSATTVFLGSSHGGYIAHLIAKLAPSIVDYVIDNSCYVKPPLVYIIGKETDISLPETVYDFKHLPHVLVHAYTKTFWTTNTQSPYYFSDDRYRIRNLMDSEHLIVSAHLQTKKPHYISYHSVYDAVAPARDKIEFYNSLSGLGYNATLHLIHAEEQIDGKLIKHLEHAMDMSLKELINTELPPILANSSHHPISQEDEISYPCNSMIYKFKQSKYGCEYKCFHP